jgi:thiamine biosynthesis lipoprotein
MVATPTNPCREVAVLRTDDGHLRASFLALGGPCEVLVDGDETAAVTAALMAVAQEAWRIEDKFSRYKPCGVVHHINTTAGEAIPLDDESAGLIDYAHACHQLSAGRFDITSGVLRGVWRFGADQRLPTQKAVGRVLGLVGWHQVRWHKPTLQLRAGMEIDLGGIGKEYAVDRAAALLAQAGCLASLVNFGGDLRANGPRRNGEPWMIGIDDPRATGQQCLSGRPLVRGAMATSGDARRFILSRGRRYGHILDPRTGWPVVDAPHSVTVQAPTCLEAGMLATFGILQGRQAEAFLQSQQVLHLVIR